MRNRRFSLAICFLLMGCGDAAQQVTDSGAAQERILADNPAKAEHNVDKANHPDERQSIIRVGDSLDAVIEELRQHKISAIETPEDIAWADGKYRQVYSVSRSRRPTDLLVLVALPKTDGTDSEIEEMYWEVDFIKQNVPKGRRPDPIREPVGDVNVSGLVSQLAIE